MFILYNIIYYVVLYIMYIIYYIITILYYILCISYYIYLYLYSNYMSNFLRFGRRPVYPGDETMTLCRATI